MHQVLKFIYLQIKGYRLAFLVMLLVPAITSAYRPVLYYAMKLLIDNINKITSFNLSLIAWPLFIIIAAEIFNTLGWRIFDILGWRSLPYIKQNILNNTLNQLVNYSIKFFHDTPAGSITSKVKGLVDGFINIWTYFTFEVEWLILSSIFNLVAISWVSPMLGVISLLWVIVFIGLNSYFLTKINYNSEAENEAKHRIIGFVADIISNILAVKLFTNRKYELARLNSEITTDYIPKEKFRRIYNFKVKLINDSLSFLILIAIILLVLKLKIENVISMGDLVLVFGMLFQLLENIWHLMMGLQELVVMVGEMSSSMSLINATNNEYENQTTSLRFSGKVEFQKVYFSYSNKPVFKDLNLIINPGEKVGVVGFTGAGKSTLVNLLLGLIHVNSGKILLNNVDLAHVNKDALRKLVALIPQDINLLHRTLFDNIHYGNLEASHEEVLKASRLAKCEEFISSLPLGYNTLVGERGIKLSGGQRQRIAIARAILRNSPILILDEATSSLDSITEHHIQESIDQVMQGRTVIAIAHRLSTIKHMDRIIVLEHGRIVACGSHQELLQDPTNSYHKIWQAQFREES